MYQQKQTAMKAYTITLQTIKNLKASFDFADNFAENNADYSNYGTEYNNEELVNSYQEKANTEAQIIADVLKISVNTVIDMAYDLEFAKVVLQDINSKAA